MPVAVDPLAQQTVLYLRCLYQRWRVVIRKQDPGHVVLAIVTGDVCDTFVLQDASRLNIVDQHDRVNE